MSQRSNELPRSRLQVSTVAPTVRVFSVCAVGADRPGILAALARRLVSHGADVAESQVAILRGYTMLTLLVRAEDDVDPFALAADLRAEGDEMGLAECALAELHNGLPAPTHQPSHIVSFYGSDQPGVLAGIATALAERDVNVLELQSRLLTNGGESESPLYVMLMEVAPPPGTSPAASTSCCAPWPATTTSRWRWRRSTRSCPTSSVYSGRGKRPRRQESAPVPLARADRAAIVLGPDELRKAGATSHARRLSRPPFTGPLGPRPIAARTRRPGQSAASLRSAASLVVAGGDGSASLVVLPDRMPQVWTAACGSWTDSRSDIRLRCSYARSGPCLLRARTDTLRLAAMTANEI